MTVTGFERPIAIHVHRVALSLSLGRLVSSDNVVDHLCYNTVCCNPKHLQEVPQLLNVRRGRKPEVRAIPKRDGTWSVRHYDYSTGERRYITSRFPSERVATAFIDSIRRSA